MYLEDKDQAVDTLSFKIQELEMQLGKEKDDCERYSSLFLLLKISRKMNTIILFFGFLMPSNNTLYQCVFS